MAADLLSIPSTYSLILELAALVVLWTGFAIQRRRTYRRHGFTMSVALAAHAVAIIAVMVNTFRGYFAVPGGANFGDSLFLLIFIHATIGVIVLILGIYLVGAWGFRKETKGCFKRKRIMIATFTLWMVAILLGVTIYAWITGI